ncbi:hypothetical protein F0562_015681 [Nyssa sinensis]|uniref:Uncharacterized protein n=1 Tax=Nyssa sinensis TaxID=561372 RepID=A0A5J4ZLR2_9ASTE|nr:hypothetical protein F0562_015681 [Nyssa sinensis]
MSADEEVTTENADLATKVDRLTEQLGAVLSWIQAQPSSSTKKGITDDQKSPPRAPLTNESDKFKENSDLNGEDDNAERDDASVVSPAEGKLRPFKVEARVEIPTFDGTVDAKKLDSWIDQLETYFTLYGFSSTEKVSFARLKLINHALTWWNAYLKNGPEQEITWKAFTQLLRQEFYPMGYSQNRWARWHNLRQRYEQTVQEYTTEFWRLAVALGITLDNKEVYTKFVAGLHRSIQGEMRLYQAMNISQASRIALAIERKNQTDTSRTTGNGKKKEASKPSKKQSPSNSSSSFKSNKYCDHCKISGHEKGKCWKLQPELFPEKWKKDEKGKRTMTVTTTSDQIELGRVEEADKSLSLMAMPKETSSSSPATIDEKEELFNVRIQIKQEVIGAIVDIGSQKNLISTSLVQKLGLDTIPHPKPYPLGWIQKDMELKIDRQCTFRFAITNQFIDEITCEVVPIDICQVIFRSPYLWERDAIYYRRAQKYEFSKDGKKFIVHKDKADSRVDLVTACQARRMVNACQRFVLLMVRPSEADATVSVPSIPRAAQLTELLENFSHLFSEFKGLPPKRAVDHEIQLISDSTLPNIAIYRNSVHQEVEQQLIRAQQKYKMRHDKHRIQGNFQEGDLVWLHLGKERLRGEGKKLKPIRYGPFKVLQRIGENACQLDLPIYMEMYSVVNVEKLKLFEPSMLDGEPQETLPSIDDLVVERETSLPEDTILEKKVTTTRHGDRESFRIGRQGQCPSKAKWFSQETRQAQFPHLQF